MNGLMYAFGKAGMLDARDMLDVYFRLQKELGVRILP